MTTVLGILALIVFVGAVIALAAAMTWVVVRLSPLKDAQQNEAKPG